MENSDRSLRRSIGPMQSRSPPTRASMNKREWCMMNESHRSRLIRAEANPDWNDNETRQMLYWIPMMLGGFGLWPLGRVFFCLAIFLMC